MLGVLRTDKLEERLDEEVGADPEPGPLEEVPSMCRKLLSRNFFAKTLSRQFSRVPRCCEHFRESFANLFEQPCGLATLSKEEPKVPKRKYTSVAVELPPRLL